MDTTVLGYPRIGARRELKQATEAYWGGRISRAQLQHTAEELRRRTWEELTNAGLTQIPSNIFSLYDHVLDTAVLFNAIPPRFSDTPDPYFAMARGTADAPPLDRANWFGTHYHHLVPELGPGTRLRLAGDKPQNEYAEARAIGIETRPVLLGPLSFLLLAKPDTPGFDPLDMLEPLLDAYAELLHRLEDAQWVQLDEPVLSQERTAPEIAALRRAYEKLGRQRDRPKILVATHFGEIGDALKTLRDSPIDGIGLDFVSAPQNREALQAVGGIGDKTLVAGVIDGRNVWRAHLGTSLATARSVRGLAEDLVVSTSCSLHHLPLDLNAEQNLHPRLKMRLAFARQKVDEVVLVGRALSEGPEVLAAHEQPYLLPGEFIDLRVRARLAGTEDHIEPAGTHHGQDDLVRDFAEHLDGYANTEHGWVQQHGAQYVRPPILYADVSRRADAPAMAALPSLPAMLTSSFVRNDQPQKDTAQQIALALSDAVRASEAADRIEKP